MHAFVHTETRMEKKSFPLIFSSLKGSHKNYLVHTQAKVPQTAQRCHYHLA